MALNHFQKQYIINQAQARGLDPELVMRVVSQESGGRMDAKSSKDAYGVFQVTKIAADDIGANWNSVKTDFRSNVNAGLDYLKKQFDTFKDPALALAAYNAGPGAVRQAGGIPNYKETKDYVANILGPGGAEGAKDFQVRQRVLSDSYGGIDPYSARDAMERFAKSVHAAGTDSAYAAAGMPISTEERALMAPTGKDADLLSIAEGYIKPMPESTPVTRTTMTQQMPVQTASVVPTPPAKQPVTQPAATKNDEQGFFGQALDAASQGFFGSRDLESLYLKMKDQKPGTPEWKKARQAVIDEVNRQDAEAKTRGTAANLVGGIAGGLPYGIVDALLGTGSAEAARNIAEQAKKNPKGDIIKQEKEAYDYGLGTNVANIAGIGVGGAGTLWRTLFKQGAANVLAGQAPEVAHGTERAGDPAAMALDFLIGAAPEAAAIARGAVRGTKGGRRGLDTIGSESGVAGEASPLATPAVRPEESIVQPQQQYDIQRRIQEAQALSEPEPRGLVDYGREDASPYMDAYGAAQRDIVDSMPDPMEVARQQRMREQLDAMNAAIGERPGAYVPEGIGLEGGPMGVGRGEMPSAIPSLVESQKSPYEAPVGLIGEMVTPQQIITPDQAFTGGVESPRNIELSTFGTDPALRSQAQVGAAIDIGMREAPQLEVPDMYRTRGMDEQSAAIQARNAAEAVPMPIAGPMRSEMPAASPEALQALQQRGLQQPVQSGVSFDSKRIRGAYDSELYKPNTPFEDMQEAAARELANAAKQSPQRKAQATARALKASRGSPTDAGNALDAMVRSGNYTEKELDNAIRNVVDAYDNYDRKINTLKCKGVM